VVFTLGDGMLTLRSARKPSFGELLAGFDPAKHRHGPDERLWDDSPLGKESL